MYIYSEIQTSQLTFYMDFKRSSPDTPIQSFLLLVDNVCADVG